MLAYALFICAVLTLYVLAAQRISYKQGFIQNGFYGAPLFYPFLRV
jgi:hypothetical protein